MLAYIKRLLGIGTGIRPVTIKDVQPAERNPHIERETQDAKVRLQQEVKKIERQSDEVQRLLAQDALELVIRAGKK